MVVIFKVIVTDGDNRTMAGRSARPINAMGQEISISLIPRAFIIIAEKGTEGGVRYLVDLRKG